MSSSPKTRVRDVDDGHDEEPTAKRTKLDDEHAHPADVPMDVVPDDDRGRAAQPGDSGDSEQAEVYENLLPPSHALLNLPPPVYDQDGSRRVVEPDVGISEYIGHDVPPVQGIIKQRFTDFLVFEVDLDGNVIHLKSLEKPQSSKKVEDVKSGVASEQTTEPAPAEQESGAVAEGSAIESAAPVPTEEVPAGVDASESVTVMDGDATQETAKDEGPWPERYTASLGPFLSADVIIRVKEMFLEGPEPPFVSDGGWAGRQAKSGDPDAQDASASAEVPATEEPAPEAKGKRGRDKGSRGGRGGRGRGGRGGGRGGRPGAREDHRKVLSDPIDSKETRTGLHQAIRELFGGKLETQTEGSAIVIKWSKRGSTASRGRGGGRGGRGERGDRGERGTYPPYIHFTLQKTNRDTQDALAYLSRSLHVNVKDLAVAGTKDKRGVTVQRVSLRRGNKTVEDIWTMANGVNGRQSVEEALTSRGERGVRVADFNYRKASLELGMLKGNAFVITLRNVRVDSLDTLDRAMSIIKSKGFINYYGMQRFGTASIPTHSIGLALLKGEWQKAVSMILRKRPGEHPDVVAAREAWLVDGDLDRALELMPRRVVAERCILESYKKQDGDTRNAMGALSTIPRNLRLMYVHAYQSYVWNAIVSERIRLHGPEKPVVGDLVFAEEEPAKAAEDVDMDADAVDAEGPDADKPTEEADGKAEGSGRSNKRSRKAWEAPKVKILTEDDLGKHTIFDVIMPLPGKDVDYPGGSLGERYRAFLKADGLDPDNFVRKQKDYTLGGSYRKILHLPKELSWNVLRYTDPDVPLAQADEDKLLGMAPPVTAEDGKFLALQIHLQLGTAAYATMALREVTKTETSSHYQTTLTQASEDQKYKASDAVDT